MKTKNIYIYESQKHVKQLNDIANFKYKYFYYQFNYEKLIENKPDLLIYKKVNWTDVDHENIIRCTTTNFIIPVVVISDIKKTQFIMDILNQGVLDYFDFNTPFNLIRAKIIHLLTQTEKRNNILRFEELFNIKLEKFCSKNNISKREKEIINLILNGHKFNEIAKQLHVSHCTIKTHAYNIYKKCDVSSKIELLNAVKDSD